MLVYQFAPFCYSGILMKSQVHKVEAMNLLKEDHQGRLKLERTAAMVPAAKAILKETEDLFPPSIRILFETFARSRYNSACVGGRRVLATMLLTIPDLAILLRAQGISPQPIFGTLPLP